MRRLIADYLQPLTIGLICAIWVPLEGRVSSDTIFFGISISTFAFLMLMEIILERHREWRINKTEFSTDLFYLLVSCAIALFVMPHTEEPLLTLGSFLGTDALWPSTAPLLVRAALALAIFELGQYWMHRLMHHSFLWRFHAPHHHITQLNVWKGAVGQPVELWLVQLSVLPLLGAGLMEILLVANVTGAISCFAHGNIAGDPPRWYKFFFTTLAPHSLHHTVGFQETRCNYANLLIVWDRVFGTFREGEAEPLNIGQGTRKRLSVAQQMAFPLRHPENVELPLLKGISLSGRTAKAE